MINKLQILSINVLVSKYKILYFLMTYFIIYYGLSLTYCMNENPIDVPLIAENKIAPKPLTTKDIMHKEISNIINYAEIIEKQKETIKSLEQEMKNLEDIYSPLRKNIRQYRDQIFNTGDGYDIVKRRIPRLRAENLELKNSITVLQQQIKQLAEDKKS